MIAVSYRQRQRISGSRLLTVRMWIYQWESGINHCILRTDMQTLRYAILYPIFHLYTRQWNPRRGSPHVGSCNLGGYQVEHPIACAAPRSMKTYKIYLSLVDLSIVMILLELSGYDSSITLHVIVNVRKCLILRTYIILTEYALQFKLYV